MPEHEQAQNEILRAHVAWMECLVRAVIERAYDEGLLAPTEKPTWEYRRGWQDACEIIETRLLAEMTQII